MAMGYHGGTVSILHLVPDDHPVPGLHGSNWSTATPRRLTSSRLDVFLNGAAVGGVALDEADGCNHVKLLLEPRCTRWARVPARRALHCSRGGAHLIGEDREHLWGTVHSDSRITMPRIDGPDRDLSLVATAGIPSVCTRTCPRPSSSSP